MKFSILFWNAWFYNQIEGNARTNNLLTELRRLANEYDPAFVALNEVAQSSQHQSRMAINELDNLGYPYHHCARSTRVNDRWLSGVTLSSRFKLGHKQNIVISNDGFSVNEGYPDSKKEAISARVSLSAGAGVNIIVAHPPAMIDSRHDHQVAIASLDRLVRSQDYARNTILVGDMNQWRLMPGALRHRLSDIMDSRTGTILRPTWRHNAHRFTPLRLNLDYLYWSKQSDFYLTGFEVLASSVSDHRPLLATFRYDSTVLNPSY